jgi:hypothetical protein
MKAPKMIIYLKQQINLSNGIFENDLKLNREKKTLLEKLFD